MFGPASLLAAFPTDRFARGYLHAAPADAVSRRRSVLPRRAVGVLWLLVGTVALAHLADRVALARSVTG